MACYDETRDRNPPADYSPRDFPRVVRDQMNVREMAEDSPCFVGHVRPRFNQGRDKDWGAEE